MATTLTYTAGDLCQLALEEAGVSAVDHPAAAEETAIALKRLNIMLKSWQNTAITVWKQSTASISIVADTQSYTITARPLSLGVVNYKNTTERPMIEMSRQAYMELPDKASAGSPTQFYYHREREQGTLYVWPVLATATGTIEWSGPAEVADVSAVSDTVEVPAEWYEAVHYGLARRLAGHFGIAERLNDLVPLAADAYLTARGADFDGSVFFVGDHDG